MTRETRKEQIKKQADIYIDNASNYTMWNIIKKLFKSIFKGIVTAILVGIYTIGIGILYLVISRLENWLFTFILIMIAFFSSIYYYSKNEE